MSVPDHKLEPDASGHPSVKCDVCDATGRIAAADSGADCIDRCRCHVADMNLVLALNQIAADAEAFKFTAKKVNDARMLLRFCALCTHECVICNGIGEL